MKSISTVLALSLAGALPAFADDAHHPDQPAAASAPTPEKAVEKMRDNTTRMQSQLEAMAAAKNPEERQKLLMEHMQTMRENMMLGQQMVSGPMGTMGCQMMGGMGMGMMQGKGTMMAPDATAASPDAMANRMHQMERRMDMMQMMMERMSQPARKPTGK